MSTETASNMSATTSTLFLGQGGETWDLWLIVAVIFAALAAGAIGVTTTGSIVAHKREARTAKLERNRAQEQTDAKVAEAKSAGIAAGRDAADALAKSKGAEAKIAEASASAEKARAETATARADLARSLATIETTKAQAANAVARAAEANLALERFKAPRTILPDTTEELARELSQYSGTDIAIYVWGEGPEPSALGSSIANLLLKAHWKAISWNWSGVSPLPGIFVIAQPGSNANVVAARDSLVAALRSAHLQATADNWPGEWDKFGGMLNGPNPPAPTAAPIRILIGSKPQ